MSKGMDGKGKIIAARHRSGRSRILELVALLVLGAAILVLTAPPAQGQAAVEYGIIASGSGATVQQASRMAPTSLFRNVQRRGASAAISRTRAQSNLQRYGFQQNRVQPRTVTPSLVVSSTVPGYGVITRRHSGQACEDIINGVRVQRGC